MIFLTSDHNIPHVLSKKMFPSLIHVTSKITLSCFLEENDVTYMNRFVDNRHLLSSFKQPERAQGSPRWPHSHQEALTQICSVAAALNRGSNMKNQAGFATWGTKVQPWKWQATLGVAPKKISSELWHMSHKISCHGPNHSPWAWILELLSPGNQTPAYSYCISVLCHFDPSVVQVTAPTAYCRHAIQQGLFNMWM